jgi:general nucleoside transport system permease protein
VPRVAVPRWVRWAAQRPVLVTLMAVVLGLIVGAFVIIFTTPVVLDAWRGFFHGWSGPGHALKITFDNVGAAYRVMFTGSVINPSLLGHSIATGQNWTGTLTPISETLTYATPLVIVSIGVGIAFQAGIFNIGANGQAVMGGIAGTAVGSMVHLPTVLLIPVTLASGVVGGLAVGALPGVLKAYTGAHEVIVTLMFNYVMYAFLLFVLFSTPLQLPNQSNSISRSLLPGAQLAPFFGASTGLRVNYGIFVAVGVVIFAWWFLERSSLGFEIRVTGANPNAARTSGISPRKVLILAFMISGGLAGLAGITQVSGTLHYIDGTFMIGSAGIGFTAITVALLGRNRPVGIVWGSLLFAALGVGGRTSMAVTHIDYNISTIIQSAIVLFVATPVLVQEIFRLRSANATTVELATKGWNA